MNLINSFLNYSTPWSLPQIYLFTANNTLNSQSHLIMGAGNAKAARDAYPELPRLLGAKIKEGQDFHLIWQEIGANQFIGALQTKRNWNEPTPFDLFEKSLATLKKIVDSRPEIAFHCPMPGVGHGRMKINDVMEIFQEWPDNIKFYHKQKKPSKAPLTKLALNIL